MPEECFWCAALGSSLCFEHCWRNGGEEEGCAFLDDFPDALDTSFSSSGLERQNPISPLSEAQLVIDPIHVPPWRAHSLSDKRTAMNDSTLSTDDTTRFCNQDSQMGLNATPDTLDSGGSHQLFSSQSLSTWSEDDQLNDCAEFQIHLRTPCGEESGTATTMQSIQQPAASAETERCNFEGCGRIYEDRRLLRQHQRSHVKPFSCNEGSCSIAFSIKRDLQRHQASVHEKRCLFCPHCQRTINGNRKDNLKRHIRKHHQGQ